MAEARLPKKKGDELLKEFEIVDRDKIGFDKPKRLVEKLNRIMGTYLN